MEVVDIKGLLVEQLKCKICKQYLKPPIMLCSTGHNCCKDCSDQYAFISTRNLSMEELAYQVYFECEHCGHSTTCFHIDEHKKNCQANAFRSEIFKCHKEIICRDYTKKHCKWSGTHDDIFRHFKRSHSKSVYEIELNVQQEYTWKLPYQQDQYNINVFHMGPVHFMNYVFYSFAESKVYFAVVRINHTHTNNDNYHFEIHINYADSYIKREREVGDKYKKLKELMEANSCIVFDLNEFKNYQEYDRHVYWRLVFNKNNC